MMTKRTVFSLGHIGNSRAYLSVERQPITYGHNYWVSFGKTYNGTIAGVVARIGAYVLMAHIRSDKALA